jgi:hypothetical protein
MSGSRHPSRPAPEVTKPTSTQVATQLNPDRSLAHPPRFVFVVSGHAEAHAEAHAKVGAMRGQGQEQEQEADLRGRCLDLAIPLDQHPR